MILPSLIKPLYILVREIDDIKQEQMCTLKYAALLFANISLWNKVKFHICPQCIIPNASIIGLGQDNPRVYDYNQLFDIMCELAPHKKYEQFIANNINFILQIR